MKTKAKNKLKIGRPLSATRTKINAILRAMAYGLTQQQACAFNGVGHTTFKDWKDRPDFPSLPARAEAVRIEYLLRVLRQAEKCKDPNVALKSATWQLERIYPRQYGQDDRAVTVFAEQNNVSVTPS